MRPSAPHNEIPGALAKTGFPLEFKVVTALRKAGWYVINSHYYLDDVDGKARELDLIAYRISKSKEVNVVTCFLISCKKDSENTWAFMSRERPAKDPNTDWQPVHAWTDIEPLGSYMQAPEWKKAFLKSAAPAHLISPSRDFFAYQLVSPDGRSPRNDKPIFDSIQGLLKALDHEITRRAERKRERKRVFNFNLMTIVDAPIVEVAYKDDASWECSDVQHLLYHARYLVRRSPLEALVHFTIPDRLDECFADALSLHERNTEFFRQIAKDAYDAILTTPTVTAYFQKLMQKRLLTTIRKRMAALGLPGSVSSVKLQRQSSKRLGLELDLYDGQPGLLDADDATRKKIAAILANMAQYKGEFRITDDLPF